MSIHVYPENDLLPHILDGDKCPCGPAVEYIRSDYTGAFTQMFTHHSLDGREFGLARDGNWRVLGPRVNYMGYNE